MKQYFKVMLGKKSCMADVCHAGGYIGVGFLPKINLTNNLFDQWRTAVGPQWGTTPLSEKC